MTSVINSRNLKPRTRERMKNARVFRGLIGLNWQNARLRLFPTPERHDESAAQMSASFSRVARFISLRVVTQQRELETRYSIRARVHTHAHTRTHICTSIDLSAFYRLAFVYYRFPTRRDRMRNIIIQVHFITSPNAAINIEPLVNLFPPARKEGRGGEEHFCPLVSQRRKRLKECRAGQIPS